MEDSALKPLEVSKTAWYSSFVAIGKEYWIYLLLGFFVLNCLILDILFFAGGNKKSAVSTTSINPFNSQSSSCSLDCVNQMNSLILSSKPVASQSATGSLSSPAVSPTPTPPTPTSTPTPAPATIKEFFVPLGTGSSTASDWTTIDGIGANIDPADYGTIKNVTFEVTIRVPTGNQTVWVRLINTAKYATMPGTEMSMNGGTPTILTSQSFNLTSGNNLYLVQMKTQLQYAAYVDMARIRIKTN